MKAMIPPTAATTIFDPELRPAILIFRLIDS
jgi:hypothetical protein